MSNNDRVVLGNHEFCAKVAVTEEEHLQGLMRKPWPPPVMIFPYNTAEIRKFWMKNTISPLDIIFCRENKVVSIHKGEPLSTQLIGPNEPCDLVVETPFGTAEKIGVKIGDPVHVIYSIATMARRCEQSLAITT
jgi:uncharacterized membrane protein (UPF0127 family)